MLILTLDTMLGRMHAGTILILGDLEVVCMSDGRWILGDDIEDGREFYSHFYLATVSGALVADYQMVHGEPCFL